MKALNMNKTVISVALAAMALTAGCASGPDRVADDFGNSVRAMREAQTYHPETRETIDVTPVATTEGARMEASLEAYRGSASNPDATSRPIQLNISE
jgi:hypothetical protein